MCSSDLSGVAKPDGLLVVPHDGELAFLHPLPVERLWGVGHVTAEKLHAHGIRTVGEVAAIGERTLVQMLGQGTGRHLHALAPNHDPRPVVVGQRRRSIGAQRALGSKRRSGAELNVILASLVDKVARRLRAAKRVCRTVTLRMRFADYTRATRGHTLIHATADTDAILAAARTLLYAAAPLIREQGLTLIGIALSNLDNTDAVQLTLPFDGPDLTALDVTLDTLRDRFGSAAITRAALLRDRADWEMPLLPD